MAPHSSTLAWKTPWTEEPGNYKSLEKSNSSTIYQSYCSWLVIQLTTVG